MSNFQITSFLLFISLSGFSQTQTDTLKLIEQKYGEQWGFCDCVVKNDSINKAFTNPLTDDEFDKISERFDYIELRCKAFLYFNQVKTPEQRVIHQQKVNECLKVNN